MGTGFQLAQVSAGYSHTCGVTGGGQAFCWGDNTSGQLGSGTFGLVTAEAAPVAVAGGLTFLQVYAGLRYTCGVAKGGQAYCWGDNTHGQLGNGIGSTDRPVPAAGGPHLRPSGRGLVSHLRGGEGRPGVLLGEQ